MRLIAFFGVHGIVYAEFSAQGQTINQYVYKNILQHLMRLVGKKEDNCGKRGHGCLIMYYAPARKALRIQKYLAKNNIAVL